MTDQGEPEHHEHDDPGEARGVVADMARLLDADGEAASPTELRELVEAWDRCRAHLEGMGVALLAAWADSGDWAADGARSAGAWLSRHTTLSRAAGAGLVRTGRTLAALSAVTEAAVELGGAKLALLARVASCGKPGVAAELDRNQAEVVGWLLRLSVDGARVYLDAWCREVVAAHQAATGEPAPDPADANRLYLSRTFASRHVLDGELDPEAGAALAGALEAEIDRWHHQGVIGDADLRCRAKLNADALMAIVRRGIDRTDQHRDVRPLVLAIIDADKLATTRRPPDTATAGPDTSGDPGDPGDHGDPGSPDGLGVPGGRCEIVGSGPVPAETIGRLLCEGDICRVVLNGASQPLDVGRRERLATADQWRALIAAGNGTCEFPGCDAPHTWCQAHHLQPWDHRGPTDIDNLALVCNRHHHLLHEGGYAMTRGPNGLTTRRPDGQPITTTHHRAA